MTSSSTSWGAKIQQSQICIMEEKMWVALEKDDCAIALKENDKKPDEMITKSRKITCWSW